MEDNLIYTVNKIIKEDNSLEIENEDDLIELQKLEKLEREDAKENNNK